MAVQMNRKSNTVFVSLLLLVVSNGRWFANLGVESYFEYGSYFLLLCATWWDFFVTKRSTRRTVRLLLSFAVVSFLFSIGILVQPLSFSTRLRLMATMLVIASLAILSEDFLNSIRLIRTAAYGLFAGTLVTTLLSLVSGTSLLEPVYEGFVEWGFNGGVQYKNYYAAIILGSFMGLFFYNRYVKKMRYDLIVMAVQIVLILISASRGSYIFLAFFLLLAYADKWLGYLKRLPVTQKLYAQWKKREQKQRIIAIVLVAAVGVAVCVILFKEVVLRSETYAYRFRGFVNYLRYLDGKWFNVLFGDAAMAWSNPNLSYVETIRRIVGYDGTYEMGFINTLIKNGFVGLVGFFLIFAYYIRTMVKMKSHSTRMMLLSVVGVLLLSSFLESFVCNIHGIFGMYCYLLLIGLCGMGRPEESEQDGCSLWQLTQETVKKYVSRRQ